MRNPCRDCPDDDKLQAAYKDEDGRCDKLCATHARERGTYVVQKPCRDCPDEDKLEAGYKDEDGWCNKLCATHARERGTYAVQTPCRDCPDDDKLEANYKDEGRNHCGTPYKELYQRTLQEQELYKDEGYRVFVVWEHEYQMTTRAKCPTHILNVVREV